MKIKTLFILLITFSIVQQGYAQKNNKVENVVLQLSINEKIDVYMEWLVQEKRLFFLSRLPWEQLGTQT